MRAIAGSTIGLILLTGCSAGVSRKLADACIKEGGMTETQCRCIADRAEKDLSKDAQEMVLAELEENQARVQELSQKMSVSDAASVGTFLMNAIGRCTTGQEGE